MEKRALRQLKRAYKTRLKVLNNKKFLGDLGNSILILVEQLKYLRDTLIIESTPVKNTPDEPIEPFVEFTEYNDSKKENPDDDFNMEDDIITTLIVAIAEFEAYQDSVEDTQRTFHFNSFWELVKINIEEWLALNDTV